MTKSHKVPMPKAAAKGGKPTMEKAGHGKHKPTGVNAKVKKEPIPQTVATTNFGQKTPTQKS